MEKNHRHLGAYGIYIKDGKILLVDKCGGPYDGKLDLPGGSIEFCERPNEALIREFKEEVGIDITEYELLDVDSVNVIWKYNDMIIDVHHIGVFYKIINYNNEIKKVIEIDKQNDDSKGADFYEISKLKKEELAAIVILELEKLGYKIN